MSESSSTKKIVFKRLSIGVAPTIAEPELDQLGREAEEQLGADKESELQYHGEIFDQFYRPISKAGGEIQLKELALEQLPNLTPHKRLTKEEKATEQSERQVVAEALAGHIFELAQKLREDDIDVYLSALNLVLAEKSALEIKATLDLTNEIFTEQYFKAIRDRGERPEIYHQIIKRVGHEHEEQIKKVAIGLNVSAVARRLWDLYHGSQEQKQEIITDTLLDLTEKQVRAVRTEFLLIPYRDLAKQFYEILNRKNQEVSQGPKRTIGKSEVYEVKKKAAYRSRDDLRSMKQILLGRSEQECELIKSFYQDILDQEDLEVEITIEAQIKSKLLPSDAERALALLDGWSASREATELHKILFPPSFSSEIDDQLSDPRDSVERDHTQGIGPYLRRFKKRRMWRGKSSIHNRVLSSYELVEERVAALSVERFFETNEALNQEYGYELDSSLFSSLALFDARRRASLIHDRIESSKDLFEVLKPLEFLTPRQSLAVQYAYECIFGVTIRQAVTQLPITEDSMAAQYLEGMLSGVTRWPLNIDLLSWFNGTELKLNVWQVDYKVSLQDENAAMVFASLLDEDDTKSEYATNILTFLRTRDYEANNRLERAFFQLTEPHVPLVEALRQALPENPRLCATALLSGLDPDSTAHDLINDLTLLTSLRDLPSSLISLVRRNFLQKYKTDLIDHVVHLASSAQDEDLYVEYLSYLYIPEVLELRRRLDLCQKGKLNDGTSILEFFQGELIRVLSLERSFDLMYPRLRVHLKYVAAKQALSPRVIAEAMLVLEGVNPQVTTRLLEFFDGVDIKAIYDELRSNRDDQRIIEESYDLLYPDASLRKSIKEMKVDLDLINEALLHLEGFYAREVAEECEQLVATKQNGELGQAILDLIAPSTPNDRNHRIPEDINWMDEMVYQIALAYYRNTGKEFVATLEERGISQGVREEITGRVFGAEVCVSAKELYSILRNSKEGGTPNTAAEERLCSYLESRGVRHRDRLLRAYSAHWGRESSQMSLFDDIAKYFNSPTAKKRLLNLLLGISAESKESSNKQSANVS